MRRILTYSAFILALTFSSCTEELCSDTCYWPNDGECDDGGEGSINDYCEFGTDCGDCGTRVQKKNRD